MKGEFTTLRLINTTTIDSTNYTHSTHTRLQSLPLPSPEAIPGDT